MEGCNETNDTWNTLAHLYQEKFMDLDLYNDSYDLICNAMEKPGARLLEIGCGPGNITRYLMAKRPDFEVFGIDSAPNMIALARQNNPTAQFSVMDARHIDTLDTRFDGIIAGFCLPYLSQTESHKLIADAYNLLNEDGYIYLSFVEGDPQKSEWKSSNSGRVYFNYHLLNDLIAKLRLVHFSNIKTSTVQYPREASATETHTILTAQKI